MSGKELEISLLNEDELKGFAERMTTKHGKYEVLTTQEAWKEPYRS
jgi:hypothetical protein